MASKVVFMLFLYLGLFIHFIYAVPERGIKEMVFDVNGQYKSFAKSLFKDAQITISGIITEGDTKGESLSLNWYLLRSNCAQYFVQVKEDILSALIVDQDPKGHPLHTVYSTGVLTFEDGHLHKTIVTLEREISKTTTAKHSNVGPPGKSKARTTGEPKATTTGEPKATTTGEPKATTTGEPKATTTGEPKATTTGEPKARTTGKPKVTTPRKRKGRTPGNRKGRTPEKQKGKITSKPNVGTTGKQDEREKRAAHEPEKKTPPKTHQPTASTTTAMKGPPKAAGLDGNYLLVISLKGDLPKGVSIQVKVSIKMNTGYLSAAEWPLLPFYGAMSLVYLAYGVVWLIVSACQWRELLRIQFWIGGVIALGMLEKAVLFSEYNNVNDTGIPAHGLVVLALVLSCIKRTLSRILIIIVSMGFGIVKPRLGAALHRVLGVGCLYFILSVIEGSYREFSVKADVSRKQVIASVPLSVLDAVICWWIFMSLLQTMRTLRIRKNLVKLSLYRHFTNILVVSVIASVAFMVWVIKAHSFNSCIKDWKEIWIDDAFWHFLFALILLAIMVLWRPTVNNQRYAFTPLIDVGEEDDDDMTLSDAFQGMKMRGKGEGETPSRADKHRKKAEDDLKWVEENIPTSGGIDTALPSLLDSDEEMMTTKLEMNKME